MDKAITAQAKKKGNVEIISTDANGDAAKLASNVEDLLSKNVDAVIISGGPLESAPAALNAIKAAGKPVVLVDRKFQTGEYTSWIGPDNEAIGKQDGEFLAEQLPGGGKVAIIKGGPADNSIGLARTNGVKSVLGQGPGITLVEAPGLRRLGLRRRPDRDGEPARHQPRPRRGVLRERRDVPGRAAGHRRRRQDQADRHRRRRRPDRGAARPSSTAPTTSSPA